MRAGEGETGVIVDGDVQGLPAGELRAPATAAVAAVGDAVIAGHALDVEMEQIAGSSVFITHYRRRGMNAMQDAADGGGTELGGVSDAISGMQLAPQGDDFLGQDGGSAAEAAPRAGRAIPQPGWSFPAKTMHHLAAVLGVTLKLPRPTSASLLGLHTQPNLLDGAG
jgi:hypothetical protein